MSVSPEVTDLLTRFAAIRRNKHAREWLQILGNLQTPKNTLLGYAYDLEDFLSFSRQQRLSLRTTTFKHISLYVNDLSERPLAEETNPRNRRTSVGLSASTMRRRISTVRQFYDYLSGEGVVLKNPARRSSLASRRRALAPPQYDDLPWIPNEEQWSRLIDSALKLSLRNRAMLALNYDSGMRKEELCLLRLGDFDHAHRTVKIRAETTKSRRSRVLPYGRATDALLVKYISTLPITIKSNESIFRSESRRNVGESITVHAWTKVIDKIASDAGVPEFHPHSLRHLCLTDLARSGWDIREIRDFAGHKSIKTTEKYIHLSGRELTERYRATMTQLHSQRVAMLSMVLGGIAK